MPASDLESRKIERAKYPDAGPSFNSEDISSETTAEVFNVSHFGALFNSAEEIECSPFGAPFNSMDISSETTAEVLAHCGSCFNFAAEVTECSPFSAPFNSMDTRSETNAEVIEWGRFGAPFNSVDINSDTTAKFKEYKPWSETFNRKRTPFIPANSFAEFATYTYAAGTSALFAMWFNQMFFQDASQSSQLTQVLLVLLRTFQIPTESLSNSINPSTVVLGVACVTFAIASAWFYHRHGTDIYQDRFLLGGSFTGTVASIALGQNILSITLSILPSTILLALMSSALAHRVFGW